MPATPELTGPDLGGGGRRLALVIATGTYSDPALAQLRAPGGDASDLARVLGDAAIGGFEVETVLDAPADSLRRHIAQFCTQVAPTDLTLIYLSCHGVLDDRGRLYYATTDTDRGLLAATAVPAAWLNEQLEDSRGRRQILVLDCCHSGAFAKGAKGEGELALGERFEGRGRVVLTGSRGTEYSFEHDQVVGESSSSVFTGALVEGLHSGDADRDGDGVVSVSELYDYAFDVVRGKEARQTPTLWTYGAEGDLAVARSPRGAIVEPVPLPGDLLMLLESHRPRVRESGVQELAEMLNGADAGRALAARAELERIAAEDVAAVAATAKAALGAGPEPSGPRSPSPPPPAPVPAPPAGPPPPAAGSRRRTKIVAGTALVGTAVAIVVALLLAGGEGEPERRDYPPPDYSSAVGFPAPGNPRGVAVEGGIAWVARYEAGKVSRIDPGSPTEPFAVERHPSKIAAGEGSVWIVIHVHGDSALQRIDPDLFGRDATKPWIESENGVVQIEIADGKLWTASAVEGAILARRLDNGDQIGQPYKPGAGFKGVFTVGDDAIWAVTSRESGRSDLVRIDLESPAESKTISFDGRNIFDGIAYGEGTVWLADSGRNQVIAFDADSGKTTATFKVPEGVTSDDIAAIPGGALVWEPQWGILTPIHLDGQRKVQGAYMPGYPRGGKYPTDANTDSDLAVGGGFAWMTDPERDRVHRVRY
jgi:hypothetical protein